MHLAGVLVIAAIAGVSYGQLLYTPLCSKNAGKFTFTLLMYLQNETQFDHMTFKDDMGVELIATCSTNNMQITGNGNDTDPFTIVIEVDPVVDINLGSPDCGHVATGNVLNWTAFVVQTLAPPIPGASGKEDEQVFSCDFDLIPENPTTTVVVDFGNVTLDNITTTVTLVQLTRNVRMFLTDNAFVELLGQTFSAGTTARLAVEVDGGAGVYGYNCMACNTAPCDDLTFPMIDADGCKAPTFFDVLFIPPPPAGLLVDTGTFMPETLFPGIPNFVGRLFTEEFILFRFVRTTDVYFRCNLGYCDSPANSSCENHCLFVRSGRKKRAAPTVDPNADTMTVVFTIESRDNSHIIDYPGQSPDPDGRVFVEPEVDSCIEKPGFVAVLALLGTAVLASVIVALGFGLKVSSESGKICGYW